jgi:ABC-2 type transport system permease protein
MNGLVLAGRRVKLEQKTFWRNPQASLFLVLLPVTLLVILGYLNKGDVIDSIGKPYVVALAPGILCFGLIATNFGNLATTVTNLRDRGILKRMRATPMPPAVFLAGQIGSTLVVSCVVALAVVACGWILFGIHLEPAAIPAFLVALLAGSACFCALGLAVTGFIRSTEAAGPVTNAVYIPLAVVSGLFSPTQSQPSWLVTATDLFPIRRFSHALQLPFITPDHPIEWADLGVLVAWGAAATVVAALRFRWSSVGT